jgi:hypothetical protein
VWPSAVNIWVTVTGSVSGLAVCRSPDSDEEDEDEPSSELLFPVLEASKVLDVAEEVVVDAGPVVGVLVGTALLDTVLLGPSWHKKFTNGSP